MSDILSTKFCNGCGEKIQYDAKFCTECGFKQIRIAKDKDYSLSESYASKYDSDNQNEKNIQSGKSNSNIRIIFLIGLVIVGFLLYIFFQNNNSNDKLMVAAADSVAVDTASVYADNIPVDTTSTKVANDSLSVVSNQVTSFKSESENSNKFTGEELARQKLFEISEAVNQDDYNKFYEIFEEPIAFHKISNATVTQIVKEVKNYKKRWQIVDENLISVNFIMTDRRGMDVYVYEKILQLERVPNNGKIYKYHISGRVLIDSNSGKINYLVDKETRKEN
jgi:ribosomal protein L40E